jgi:subtilisin family serine protease
MEEEELVRRRLVLATGMALLMIATLLPAAVSARAPGQFGRVDAKYKVDPKLAAELLKLRDAHGNVMVFVELTRPSVAESIAPRIDAGENVTPAQRAVLRVPLRQEQAAVQRSIERLNGRIHASFTDVMNGFRASVPAASVAQISQLVGVKAIYRVGLAERENETTAKYLNASKTWKQTGFTGAGVKVAVIDTGINYYHKDFNGAGEPANSTDDPEIIEPGSFPTAKVVAGWDFVGDAYDPADPANADAMPDPDPKDCNGHGTHVAGTAAGMGVKSDGTTYTGPYNTNGLNNTDWNVAPGMAPRASLMAYKVFGCDGGTYVVLDAIERAVREGAQVINMSLGLEYGNGGRGEEIAVNNAVRSGVTVVTSIGNYGPSAYVGGSPGTSDGAIAVAALDANPGFPSVWIDMPTGDDVRGINANGNTNGLPVTGDLNVFKDDPATPCDGDTGLGCEESGTHADSYTFNTYVAGEIPVTFRGNGARVDRAIEGDAQGAPAVIMVNNSSGLPPFEGPIAGADIPFVGVSGEDEGHFVADDGGTATISQAPDLSNPGFGHTASFSSAGFRRVDQLLKPDVIAPGVSVFSADANNVTGAVGISGTSMASPAVAGVAALVRQAWPNLNPRQIKSLIVNTADPSKVDSPDLRKVGAGVVDALRATKSKVHITVPNTEDGGLNSFQPSLAFGLAEIVRSSSEPALSSTRSFRIYNRSAKAIKYKITNQWQTADMGLNLQVSPSTVTVPANSDRLVTVTITMSNASAAALSTAAPNHGAVLGFDEFGQLHLPLEYIGGRLLVKPTVLKSGVMLLRVPWAVVPRGTSNIWGELGSYTTSGTDANANLAVHNGTGGVHSGYADIFQHGLQDQREGYDGMDIRAVGFQSLPPGVCDPGAPATDVCLNVAINNWTRFSNASENIWIIAIDTDADGTDDYEVWGIDAALLIGTLEGVFISVVFDIAAGEFTFLYLATAPTNSSTIMLPFLASDIGLTAGGDRDFEYYGLGLDNWDDDGDPGNPVVHLDLAFTGSNPGAGSLVAHYNAFAPVLSNGQFEELAPGASANIGVSVDTLRFDPTWGMKGWMIVSLDDPSGERQADLINAGPVPDPS